MTVRRGVPVASSKPFLYDNSPNVGAINFDTSIDKRGDDGGRDINDVEQRVIFGGSVRRGKQGK